MQSATVIVGFWGQQLQDLIASNAFSVASIVSTWTSGIANVIVKGGSLKAAWEATQVAIVQAALNTGVQLAAQWALQAGVEMGILTATEAAKIGLKTSTNAAIVAGDAAAAGATVGIWAGASAAILGFFAGTLAGFEAIVGTMVATVTAVGTFVMGVLSAIAAALTATVFGIPWAGAILVGIGLIAAALAATGAIEFAKGGIVTRPTLGLLGEAGPEAVIPLRDTELGSGGTQQTIIIELDGREISRNSLRYLPALVRMKGVPA